MNKKSSETYEVKIYSGLKEGYEGETSPVQFAHNLIQKYCDEQCFGVTVTETKFIYTEGNENGIIVELINYPRFPKTYKEIFEHAEKIAAILLVELKQQRISIVATDKTLMIEA